MRHEVFNRYVRDNRTRTQKQEFYTAYSAPLLVLLELENVGYVWRDILKPCSVDKCSA